MRHRWSRRVINWRIRVILRRGSPYCDWIILRYVDNLRARRLYLDICLIIFGRSGDGLFLRRLQSARGTRLLTQALHSVHDVLLLRQECIAKVRSPTDILIEALQYVGQHHEPLHACVPRLFCRSVGEFLVFEIGMLAQPPSGFHDLDGIRRCDEHLAQDRIRV